MFRPAVFSVSGWGGASGGSHILLPGQTLRGNPPPDVYKRQLTYGNEDNESNVYYHILKTDYYEQDASEITGLNTVAFGVLFPVEFMDSCEEMKIQEWPAALYKKGEMAYLCWTYSPEISYVLEYKPSEIQDSEIIKMAESAKEVH